MKKPIIIAITGLLAIAGAFVVLVVLTLPNKSERADTTACMINPDLATITIGDGDNELTAEVTDNNATRARGLSGRNCIEDDHAMLFSYETAGQYCFWMKEMNFAIDMIWLNDEKEIVTIHDRVPPSSFPDTFCPDDPANYIIEVDAGRAAELGWQVGDTIPFSPL